MRFARGCRDLATCEDQVIWEVQACHGVLGFGSCSICEDLGRARMPRRRRNSSGGRTSATCRDAAMARMASMYDHVDMQGERGRDSTCMDGMHVCFGGKARRTADVAADAASDGPCSAGGRIQRGVVEEAPKKTRGLPAAEPGRRGPVYCAAL